MINTKIIVGLDPGSSSGAWAVLDQQGKYIDCGNMLSNDGRVDVNVLHKVLQLYKDTHGEIHIAVEEVGVRPGQGISSSGKFMRAAGAIEAVATLIGDSMVLVRPQVWKKHHGLIGTEKIASLELARAIWPEAPLKLKKDHNKADALLIALWLRYN